MNGECYAGQARTSLSTRTKTADLLCSSADNVFYDSDGIFDVLLCQRRMHEQHQTGLPQLPRHQSGLSSSGLSNMYPDPAVELAQLQTADRGLNFGNAPVGSERFVQPTEPGCVLGVDKLIQE